MVYLLRKHIPCKILGKFPNKIAKLLFAPDLRPSKCQRTIGQGYPLMERKKKTFIRINMREIERDRSILGFFDAEKIKMGRY